MAYYNHYNLDEACLPDRQDAEEINTSEEVYQMQFIELPIIIQDHSRTFLKVIFDGLPDQKKAILQQIQNIYSVGQTQFRQPNELSIFMEFPIHDFSYIHDKILEAIDNAYNPNFSFSKPN